MMGEPGRPDTGRCSEIVEAYQRVIRQEWSDGDAGLLEEILRGRVDSGRESQQFKVPQFPQSWLSYATALSPSRDEQQSHHSRKP
jgi:hypothetical protein